MPRKTTLKQKKDFVRLRKAGFSVKVAALECGFSKQTGNNLERRRKRGDLQIEILDAEQPMEMDALNRVIGSAMAELQGRDIKNMTTSQLVTLVSRGVTAMKGKSKKEEPDELDKIWEEVTKEKETNNYDESK